MSQETRAEAKARAKSYGKISADYFKAAAKAAGFDENSPEADVRLLTDQWNKATAGLDKDVAFQAMNGGRVFGESDMKRYNELLAAKNGGGNSNTNTTQSSNQQQVNINMGGAAGGGPSYSPGVFDGTKDGSFAVGGDLNQNVGKQGDMTTSIGDNNQFGAGSSIGNDYSVTIGSNSAGNDNRGGLSNMQGAAAYSALNNNQFHRSQSQLNGFGRAAGATEEAEKSVGSKPRVANLYNLTGMDQNYWNNKAKAQQGFYLGDIFKQSAPNWVQPPSPSKPEDKTESIANSFDP